MKRNIKILQGDHAREAFDGDDASLTELVTVLEEAVEGRECPDIVEKVRDRVSQALTNGDATVAMVDDQIAGMAVLEPCGEIDGRRVFEVRRNVVLPEHRNATVIKKLLIAILRQALSRDPNALLHVTTKNPSVMGLCERFGTTVSQTTIQEARLGRKLADAEATKLEEDMAGYSGYLIDPKKLPGQFK